MLLFPGCLPPDHTMTVRHTLLPALLGLGVACSTASMAVMAQQGSAPGSRLTPQQQEQLFPEQKQLWLNHAQARSAALQAGQRCVQAARNPETFRNCLNQERQRNMELRRTHWTEMRALLARYGIKKADKPERRWGPADGAGGGLKKGSAGGAPAGAEI